MCEKAKSCKKNFHQNCCYITRFEKFVDYETTSKCQLCNFSEENVLGGTFNFIT